MSPQSRFFAVIGAQRSGTTMLYDLLDQHPEICMAKPVRPEPKFFLSQDLSDRAFSEYLEKHYPPEPGHRAFGEKSTSYLEIPGSASRMLDRFPDAKALVILREPVERAVSNYYFSVKNGLETRSPEEVFVEKKPAPTLSFTPSVSPFAYVERGLYVHYLRPWLDVFPSGQLHVLIYEELLQKPDEVLANMFGFLGVDAGFRPRIAEERVNTAAFGQPFPDGIRDELARIYREAKPELEAFLGRPIPYWP
jgi:hypothetical protein